MITDVYSHAQPFISLLEMSSSVIFFLLLKRTVYSRYTGGRGRKIKSWRPAGAKLDKPYLKIKSGGDMIKW
jgi:hypothetical protein